MKHRSRRMIVAAAIKLRDGRIFVGKRHADAIRNAMLIFGIRVADSRLFDMTDGFLTDDLRFLNREEAFVYAKETGQFRREELAEAAGIKSGYNGTELFSEDIW
jgi:hypothetical protein